MGHEEEHGEGDLDENDLDILDALGSAGLFVLVALFVVVY